MRRSSQTLLRTQVNMEVDSEEISDVTEEEFATASISRDRTGEGQECCIQLYSSKYLLTSDQGSWKGVAAGFKATYETRYKSVDVSKLGELRLNVISLSKPECIQTNLRWLTPLINWVSPGRVKIEGLLNIQGLTYIAKVLRVKEEIKVEISATYGDTLPCKKFLEEYGRDGPIILHAAWHTAARDNAREQNLLLVECMSHTTVGAIELDISMGSTEPEDQKSMWETVSAVIQSKKNLFAALIKVGSDQKMDDIIQYSKQCATNPTLIYFLCLSVDSYNQHTRLRVPIVDEACKHILYANTAKSTDPEYVSADKELIIGNRRKFITTCTKIGGAFSAVFNRDRLVNMMSSEDVPMFNRQFTSVCSLLRYVYDSKLEIFDQEPVDLKIMGVTQSIQEFTSCMEKVKLLLHLYNRISTNSQLGSSIT